MSGGIRAAVVVVGSEILLDGRTDTNGPHIESVLASEGIDTILRLVVGDELGSIASAIREASRAASVVIVSGGLGPTFDDVTREAAAEAVGATISRDPGIESHLRERLRARGMTPPESVFRMADVISGAEILKNAVGSAPGQLFAGPPMIALLPGVPAELQSMLAAEVLPRVRERFNPAPPARAVFKVAGLYESEVEGLLSPVMASWKGIQATILASPGDVALILRSPESNKDALLRAAGGVRSCLGEAIYAEDDEGLESAVGRILAAARRTLSTAESCTGGMLGSMLTSVPGSSAYYLGGAVAYSDRLKETWLGVPSEILARHGAVSAEAAAAMARGARDRTGSDLALAITGVAGPGGGTAEKPVGLVHLAFAAPWGVSAKVLSLPGERATIRIRACRVALDLLRREMLRHSGGGGTA